MVCQSVGMMLDPTENTLLVLQNKIEVAVMRKQEQTVLVTLMYLGSLLFEDF